MLVDIQNLEFGYKAESLLENVNVQIHENDKIGLVGANGIGKSTLLSLILGELTADNGNIFCKKNLNPRILKQNSGLQSDNTVYDEMLAVFESFKNAILKHEEISKKLASCNHESLEYKKLTDEFGKIENFIHANDAYNYEIKIKTILNGMGFEKNYNQIISTMSGGEKTRLALAKLLLEEPELLILDEPTNHLDFETLNWLENFLTTYKGAILVVSHDRYFLDNLVTKIWEIENSTIYDYSGNYTKYKQTKKEIQHHQLKEYQKQQEQIASMKEYAQKNIVRASTSKSAKSRLAQLEHIDEIEKPRIFTKPPKFRFDYDFESNKNILNIENLNLSIDGKVLLENSNFEILKGEKVALIGANGTGKSTLIKTIVSRQSKSVRFGKNLKIGYYDQENTNLDFENTVLDELWGKHTSASQTEMRSLLGSLLLGAEDISKKIKNLSGGERAKLGFALIMADKPNTLILDEPTNHLDLQTREALEQALREYTGTIFFVSHDRYFLSNIATKIIEISDKTTTTYKCGYKSYDNEKKLQSANAIKEAQQIKIEKKSENSKFHRTAQDRKIEAQTKLRISNIEKEMNALESKEKILLEQMSNPVIYQNYDKYKPINDEQMKIREKIDALFEEWAELSEKISC